MYKQIKDQYSNMFCVIVNLNGNSNIPFDPANTDYAEFKKAVTAGAELQDAEGNVMTEQAAQDFIRTLP